ncbi:MULTISPECIES: hypothetical protein [unclassified Clostridium]|uniref:hypothetical protein n=1 Tax=unclassified Clostridium TaxID=2614128 RepID=UPI000E9EE5B2|nr:hypothetical protein [Clostridium sp.]
MNSVEMKTLIKVIFVCILLFIFSPLIFGVLGIVFKGILWLILGIVIIITLSIMYLKYKVKKETNEFYSSNENGRPQGSNSANVTPDSESYIDYSDSTIVDVEEYEESNDKEE